MIVLSLGAALFATGAAVFTGGFSIFFACAALLFFSLAAMAATNLRTETIELTEGAIRIKRVDRRSLLPRLPMVGFRKRTTELRWEHVLEFSRSRLAADGPAVVLHLSDEGTERARISRFTLPAITSISIEELEEELQVRWRHALLKLGVL
ncbi:MAG: hypothetical protein ACRELY_21795, partial [Polyangiaceae bacterium]